jgi:hypothetical protein
MNKKYNIENLTRWALNNGFEIRFHREDNKTPWSDEINSLYFCRCTYPHFNKHIQVCERTLEDLFEHLGYRLSQIFVDLKEVKIE